MQHEHVFARDGIHMYKWVVGVRTVECEWPSILIYLEGFKFFWDFVELSNYMENLKVRLKHPPKSQQPSHGRGSKENT